MMEFQRIDHVVFTVCDTDPTCAFYHRVLDMETVTFDGGRKALRFGECKINLHQTGREVAPAARRLGPEAQYLRLVTTSPIPVVVDQLRRTGVEIVDGPVPRMGALGGIESVYLRDPDGNLIEIGRYVSGG